MKVKHLLITKFVLYDGRSKTLGSNSASKLEIANIEEEAKKIGRKYGDSDGIWYECEFVDEKMVKEKARWDIPSANTQ